MKKMKLMKVAILFLTILAFSNCEEDGAIQFIVVDDFGTSVSVKGLEGKTAFTISSSTNVSDLLDNANTFVAADVESVTLELVDYSGTSINGTISVSPGLATTPASLSSTPITIPIPANSSAILSLISSGNFPVTIVGNATAPIEDNDFSIKMTFRIKATVE